MGDPICRGRFSTGVTSDKKAGAAYVREKTGFSIGGVPPVGHAEQPETFVDEDLLDEEEI